MCTVPSTTAIVAGTAPLSRTLASMPRATSRLSGCGSPWLMIVDSSATTARPSASAVATSGWIRTSGLGCGDRGHVRVEVGEHPIDDGLAQPELGVAVRAGAELAESAGPFDRRLLALPGEIGRAHV